VLDSQGKLIRIPSGSKNVTIQALDSTISVQSVLDTLSLGGREFD
jgi:hypothetical protein